MLLGVMLALLLAFAVPALATSTNTGNVQTTDGLVGFDSTIEGSESGLGAPDEDSCRDQIADGLAAEFGTTTEEVEELPDLVRGFSSDEEFDALVEDFCVG